MFEHLRFERESRTASSEVWEIIDGERPLGRVDLHFGSSQASATLTVVENLTDEEVQRLIDAVDEELVLPAGVPREDFVVTVFQGRVLGVFSDEYPEGEYEGNGH
ncbi:MAG: hypothetical protein HY330_01960 [Chloroflexi bacterium]|nr:hypothetical protein [Chloroflexota bacterium]